MGYSNIVIAFDLDGTLNMTHLYALKAYCQTFKELKVGPFSDENILTRFGATFEEDIEYFFSNPNANTVRRYKTILSKYWKKYLFMDGKTFPQVEVVLQTLYERGHILCICSNAPIKEIEETLKVLHIRQFFDKIAGSDGSHTKDEVLANLISYYSSKKIIMVGDRHYDLNAAKKNNVLFIACLYGYGKAELETALYKIETFQELPEIIKKLQHIEIKNF